MYIGLIFNILLVYPFDSRLTSLIDKPFFKSSIYKLTYKNELLNFALRCHVFGDLLHFIVFAQHF